MRLLAVVGAALLAAMLLSGCRCAEVDDPPAPIGAEPTPDAAPEPPAVDPEPAAQPPAPTPTASDHPRSPLRWTGDGPAPDFARHVEFCDAIVRTDPRAESKPRALFLAKLACLHHMGWEVVAQDGQARAAARPRARPKAKASAGTAPPAGGTARREAQEAAGSPPSPLEKFVIWTGDGPRQDLASHQQFCRSMASQDPRAAERPGLQFLATLSCLRDMGWELDQGALEP